MSALPRTNYATHPAYGGMLSPDEAMGRDAAAALQPFIDESAKTEEERKARVKDGYGSETRLGDRLVEAGAVHTNITSSQLEAIRAAAAPTLSRIADRVSCLRDAGEKVNYKAVHHAFDEASYPELYSAVREAYAANGFFDLTARYFKANKAKVKSVGALVNTPDQDWATGVFRDGAVKDPVTAGFHIDSNGKCFVKAVLYLNDVGVDQGPFGSVPGSHHWEDGSEDRIIRRAFDKSPKKRQMFISLPKHMQTKAEFGGDMLDDDTCTKAIVEAEEKLLGEKGRIVLFDPESIHRGGNVRKGERQVLLITMAPQW
jgi:hypothetical protein